MATVLGVGDNSGSDTLTVTLSAAQPPGSFVHAIHAAVLKDIPFSDVPSVGGPVTDSKGGLWSDGSGHSGAPILGAISDTALVTPPNHVYGLQLGQTSRRTPLSAPDLGIGDTVTVTWNDGGYGPSHMGIVAIVVAFTEFQIGVTQYLGGTTPGDFVGIYYSNGNAGSLMPGPWDHHTLNWTTAGLFLPYPHDAAVMLTGAATYPAAVAGSYLPSVGSVVTQHNSADSTLSLAVTLASAPALTAIEPGGSFAGSSVNVMVGNYQFATGTLPPTKRCKTCGGMLGGISVGSTFTRWV